MVTRNAGPSFAPMRLILLFLVATGAHAQASWSTLTPAAGIAIPVESGFPAWSTGASAAARVETPAWSGRARAELRLATYDTDRESLPEFTLVVPTLGWGPALDVGPARLGAGGRVGIAFFRLDDDTAGNLQNEAEMAVGAWAGGAFRLGRAELWAEVDATRFTLSEPTTLVTVGSGLAVRLDTPRWLRRVLQ